MRRLGVELISNSRWQYPSRSVSLKILAFSGPAGLKEALLSHPDRFVTTVAEKIMIYALGRGVEYYDAPAVRAVVREAANDNYRLSALVKGVAMSKPFRMRRSPS